ncbi:hypothetical protein [Flavobacterium sp. 7A]|uniref:hypothetical protein n=1 Tax=Flavobacterium sp. 7A TaxID=2940571 RepID=UPI002227A214|nr:hypothetical protein [Flavobacterium sp. 7A]MCW2120314.1 hypothetical protein [Flavobacterium sp. 7A]
MNSYFEKHEIENAFEKIKNDELFKRSSLLTKILRYLIDQALSGNDVKEQTIGIDVLKEKYETDQNDSKVRVYIFNLRKKLVEYNANSGKDEAIVFHIEKGQYNLAFNKKEVPPQIKLSKKYYNIRLSLKSIVLFGGIFILGLFTFLIIKWNKPTNIWNSFTENNSTLCVIADKFVVANISKEDRHFALYHDVNTIEQFELYKKVHPKKNLKEARFTMMSKMAPFGIHYLDLWFNKFNSTFNLKLETEVQYEDYAINNVIYIGQYKTMTTSKSLFLKNSNRFTPQLNGFTYQDAKEVKEYKSKLLDVDFKEYVMVSYQRLKNGKHTLFVVSNHDIGVIGALKLFTNTDSLNKFLEKLPEPNSYFNALFEVNGLKRNEIDTKLVHIEIMP